jgi:parvulin-like peptidyl-prolyl isomerase
MYSHWFERVRPRHILVKTKAEADSILAQLESGADFGDMAEEHSIDQGTAIRGGDFGREFRWIELISPLRELVFSLEEGEIGGPVESDHGWHIMRAESCRELENVPIEQLWTPIENTLRRRAQDKRRIEQLDDLRERASISLLPDGLAVLKDQISAIRDTLSNALKSRRDIPIDSLPDSVRSMTFASYGRDGTITLEDIARKINSLPWDARPDASDEEQLQEGVFQTALFDILREEALRLKMDEEPIYKERLLEFQEKLMSDKMRTTIVSRNLRVTEEDVRSYYDARPDSFVDPIAYRVREVLLHDSAVAEKVLREAKVGTPLLKLAEQYTERPGFKGNGGDLGWVRPDRYSDLYETASRLDLGEVGGPVPGAGQYSVIELLEVQPARPRTYEEVQPSLFKKIQEHRTDSIVAAFMDSMKVLYPVVIHDDILERNLRVTEIAADTSGR